MAVEVQRVADSVQALALHNLGACRGQESLVVAWKRLVEKVGDNGVDHSVAEELQAFVVGPVAIFCLDGLGAVHHGEFVEVDILRVVASDAVNKNIKLLILDEKEPYE